MRVLQLATFLSLGAGSLSLLVPPSDVLHTDAKPAVDDHNLSPEAAAIAALTQSVRISCESCPFPSPNGDGEVASFTNTPNDLVLTLGIDPNRRDTITLNGKPLFPTIYTKDAPKPYTVVQRSLVDGTEFQVPADLDLFIESDATGLSRLRLHVLGVAGWKTRATMSILEFPVFQNKMGEIFIGEVHVRPPTPAEASAVMCQDNFICRWKAYLYDAVHKMAEKAKTMRKGGCRGKKHGHAAGAADEKESHGHPHHHHHSEGKEHHGHDHKWRWFKWVSIVVRLVLACLVIAAITITIGLFFTLVVSSFIHLLISTWMFVRGRACPARRQAPVDEEEQGLMSKEDESAMDAVVQDYSDELPVYVENQDKK
ncbi:hypothetical protein TWF696_001019 [Orbilia brochopaga]|uniref:Uncharacterized protein n=1 Tax=Orbilia brochopaga TaxID=3140254 RepID=A0AAV9VFG5_9PEZI